ncbi:MAG: hypothetical protein ABUK01_05905 [Leptospirales bacterium]
MAMTTGEIEKLLKLQVIDPDEGTLLLQPLEELPCIYDLLEAYLPDQSMGFEILEAQVSETTATGKVEITGYASVFGLPPVKISAVFIIQSAIAGAADSTSEPEGEIGSEEVALTILVIPEMGVTPAGLFPELTGSGLWVPLIDLKLELKSNADNRGVIEISDGIVNPGLDDLLAPLLPLLGEFVDLPRVTGTAEIGEAGTVQKLRIETPSFKPITIGAVTLSDIKIALIAEENETGLLQAALLLEGEIAISLGDIDNVNTITVKFQLIPAPPDRPFHVLYAELGESDNQTADATGLGIPMPANMPEIQIQSIRVLLGAVSGIPEDITIVAVMDEEDELELLPGLTVSKLGGAFTIWPTTDPVSGHAEIYGQIKLGNTELNLTLEVPEQEFSIELVPETAPDIQEIIEGLLAGVTIPDSLLDMQIDGLRISGNVTEKQYQFYFGLSGIWDFNKIIGLEISLKAISISGNVDASGATTKYFGVIRGMLQLGKPGEGESDDNGLLQLSAELTSAGDWILEGGLAPGSDLSLPQLVSVVGIDSGSIPGDLQTLTINELNASINTGNGKASFHAASGFSLALPFGGGDLELKGSISLARESTGDDWVGEAGGEMKYKTIRLKAAFPINNADIDLTIGLWLPQAGDPDAGAWLECTVDKDASGSIEKLTISLSNELNIFAAIEGFINLMIPGFAMKFPPPWDQLKDLTLPPTTIEINPKKNTVSLSITGGFDDINQVPGIDIQSVGLLYDTKKSKIEFQLVGGLFGTAYTKDDPLSFDPVTEDLPTPKVPDVGFELRYLGVGRHVSLRNAAGYDHVADAIDDLRHAFDIDPREGAAALGPLTYNSGSEWLIGFDFSAAGFLSIGAIFNDPVFYGLVIRLDGPGAKSMSGFELEIMYKRIAPGLGVYSIELELPSAIRTLELGAITLRLPVVGIDIFTNGNFKLDMGFPYGANFERSFYISVLPFTGAGGFYFASLNGATSTVVPRIVNGEFDPVIEFGIGLQVGIGKSFGSGCFYAEINVSVLAILEGCFATFLPYDKNAGEALFYRISGTFGIYAILTGRVDFGVLCVNFTAELYLIAQVVVESYAPFFINARAGVRVSARVKIGWFTITLRFSQEVSVSYTFGSRKATPWIVGTRAVAAGMGRGHGLQNHSQNRQMRMTMSPDGTTSVLENNTFDWARVPAVNAKIPITWYSWFGVSIDLETKNADGQNKLSHIPVATPLIGFAEMLDEPDTEKNNKPPEDFALWIERVFHWLLTAWPSNTAGQISFSSASKMDRALQEDRAAASIGWSELNDFIFENFSVTLRSQPLAQEGGEYKMALVPLPPALFIQFDIDGTLRELDLSVEPLVDQSSLSNIKERSSRYTPGTISTPSGAATSNGSEAGIDAPMSEWLWKDAISLQIKELASRLLSLMEACPIQITGEHAYTSMGDIYEPLVYDPDPNDADREPYFEDFVEANMAKIDILKIDFEIIIPQESGDLSYNIEDGDSLETIADAHGITAIELATANLDVDLVRLESTWTVPYIKELSPEEAWQQLIDANALSDIAAMTSRFLLHGVRIPVKDETSIPVKLDWKNLYEAAALQFELPITEKTTDGKGTSITEKLNRGSVKLTLTPSANGHKPEWLIFENEVLAAQALTDALSNMGQSAQNMTQIAQDLDKIAKSIPPAEQTEETKLQIENIDKIVKAAAALQVAIDANNDTTLTSAEALILAAQSMSENVEITTALVEFKTTKTEVDKALLKKMQTAAQLDLEFTENEDAALGKILNDTSFVPEATVTAMEMTREEQLDFSLARAIPLRRLSESDDIKTYGRLRVLPPSFFQFLESSQKEGQVDYDWVALRARRSSAAENIEEPRLNFQWAVRLDIEVYKLDKEAAVEGRTIYRIAGLSPNAQLQLERTLADAEQGLITVSLAPSTGVAGAATSSGGLLVGQRDAKEIILFRNDADDRLDTPAGADNRSAIDFLRLLAESLDEEAGSFFFADVLPGVDDVEERIFAGGKKGKVTLMIFPEGQVDPLRHADSIYLDEAQDKGSAPIRLTADGLTQKKARFERDMLHFRLERPEPEENTADALESLYSLVSFYFSDENGDNPSPASLPIGPREVQEGTWLYEQVIPVAAAFKNRSELAAYSAVGKTRWLNISWRDLFGNEASSQDFSFAGLATPVAPKEEKIKRLPLTCYYYDDIIGVNRWPGVQATHVFQSGATKPQLSMQIKFDPSMLGEKEDSVNAGQNNIQKGTQNITQNSTESTKEELAKVIAQLQDTRLQTFIQTSLEAEPSLTTKQQWKSDLLNFLRGVDALMISADTLEPLEISPASGVNSANGINTVNIEAFLIAHRITEEELSRAIQTLPLGEFLNISDGIPLLKIPIKWQIGTDSLNSIALALKMASTDVLIESLLERYLNEPGIFNLDFVLEPATESTSELVAKSAIIGRLTLAAPGSLTPTNVTSSTDTTDFTELAENPSVIITPSLTIAEAAAGLNTTPGELLLEFADREGLLAPKKVIITSERNEAMQADESLGELARRMLYTIEVEIIGGSITNGFAIAPDQIEIIAANRLVNLSETCAILLENRLVAPTLVNIENGEAGEAWKSSQATSIVAVGKELSVSPEDFVAINARRADILQPNIELSVIVVPKTSPSNINNINSASNTTNTNADSSNENTTFTIRTIVDDSFDTLRKAFSALAGKTISSAEFASAIAEANILKPGSFYLAPPVPVILSRNVQARKTPAAYELKASLVLQRFSEQPAAEDIEFIHPQMRDKKSVWYVASEIAPSGSGDHGSVGTDSNKTNKTKNKTATLRPYALAFQNALAKENLHLGMGAKRRGGGDKPSLWAVRLGKGGFHYQIDSKNPAFLSLRPLATTPMNRKDVAIFKFIEDKANLALGFDDPVNPGTDIPNEAYELKNYSDIDFDEWAKRSLELFDRMLRPACALAFSEIEVTENGHTYDELLAARAKLASALTTGLTEIIDYPPPAGIKEPAESEVTRRIMKERIGNRLASAYDIDTAVMFPLTFTNAAGEPFEAKGSFLEDRSVATDTGYTLQSSNFSRNEDYLTMAVDVLKPEEHRTVDTKVAFQLDGLEFENPVRKAGDNKHEEIVLSFVIPPCPNELGELEIPVALRDMPEAPRLSRQQGVADFEMNEKGYPEINSFDDLLAWRYEVDFLAEFAEQDNHTMEIFFNLKALVPLPPMLGGYNGRLFQDLFHALAQCNETLEKYSDMLEARVEARFATDEKAGGNNNADLHWILDDMIVLVDELADHWRELYERGGVIAPATYGETLQTSKHRYEFTEERYTETNAANEIIKDDLRYVFTCAPDDPAPLVRVNGVTGVTSKPKFKTVVDAEGISKQQAVFTVTMKDWFRDKTSDELEEMPRRIGFQHLHILEKQNVRVRIKTTRNAKLLEGKTTAEAFVYRTPIVTLPDRFFPSVEMEKRVAVSSLTPTGSTKKYNHPTELLADILHHLLGLGFGQENAGITRRLALSVRYGFSLAGDWSEVNGKEASFASETPLFFEPRFILDHVPNGVDVNADDAVSRLGREMQEWLENAGARRENAGFVIGIDVYTDETLNPALVEKHSDGQGARDDARLLKIMRLEAEFPG